MNPDGSTSSTQGDKNSAFIKAWKQRSHNSTQQTLQTRSEAFIAWALTQGWPLRDVRTWTSLLEKAKSARHDDESSKHLKLLLETLDTAGHADVHPVGLISYARIELHKPEWDFDALDHLKETILAETDEDDIVDEVDDDDEPRTPPRDEETPLSAPGAPKRARKHNDISMSIKEEEADEAEESE